MTDEEIRALVDEFRQKADADPEIRSVMEKIRNQEADLDDTSRLCLRRSELMGQFMQDQLPELTPGDRERLCTALLRNGYDVANEAVPDVLRAQDECLGLHLNPVRAPFPWERVQKVSHSLEDPGITEEQRNRRAGAPVANTSMSFHDDSVKENAKIRAKLGFKCYLNRVAASGCCKWCTDIAGRYVYGDHPGDIFRRHDNCGCTVTFENGRQRQDVWSKQTWQASPAEILAQYRGPVRFSERQAAAIQEINRPMTLTGGADGGIIGIDRELKPRSFDSIRRFAENDLKLSFSDSLKNVPNETFKVIVDSLHKLNKEIPELSGFVEEVVLSDMSEMAMASLRFEDGKAHAYLKLSSQLFTQYSLDEIDDIIHTLGEAHEISSKNGIYGVLKHEYLHFVEYQKTIAKFGGKESRVKESLTRYELASEIKELVFKNLVIEQTDEVIKHYISNYATKNAAEFIAEAYSSADNNIVVNEAKRVIKKKWGV